MIRYAVGERPSVDEYVDLGVSRDHLRQGIGSRLVAMAHEAAGGAKDVRLVTWANGKSMPFYESCGLRPSPGLVAGHPSDWDLFTVAPERT